MRDLNEIITLNNQGHAAAKQDQQDRIERVRESLAKAKQSIQLHVKAKKQRAAKP